MSEVDIPDIDVPTESAIDIPDIELGSTEAAVQYVVEPDQRAVAVKYGIIGSGQAGGRVADMFWKMGYRRVCAINTTDQDFLGLSLPKEKRLVMGSHHGAGKDPAQGLEALEANTENVLNLMRHSFGEDIDRIIVTGGAGGGTGSGTVQSLVHLAKMFMSSIGKEQKVGVIVTLPKKAEGGLVQANAYNLISDLLPQAKSKLISPLVVVDNESINRRFPHVSAKDFWDTANKNIVGLFDVFNILACQKSAYTTFDKADYQTVLDSGLIIFGATAITNYQKDTDLSDGLRKNLEATLLADADIKKATHVAAILCAQDKILGILPQSHIDLAFSTLERVMGGEGRGLMVHQGVYEVKKPGLFLYTMVGGLELSEKRLLQMKARAGL
jgi:cell division GTPase FtsZ